MLILALDTSQLRASLALLDTDSGKVSATLVGNTSVAHSEAVLPLVSQVLNQASRTIAEVDAFAVGIGPGSFTGIRIGMATIKALAQVHDKKVIPVSSLRATYFAASRPTKDTVALVNAYQGLVFAGFELNGEWTEQAISVKDWCAAHLNPQKTFVGSGVRLYSAHLPGIEPQAEFLTPESLAQATLECLKMKQQGALLHYTQPQANYLRVSQAEINLQGR